jgi:hypothetical protein
MEFAAAKDELRTQYQKVGFTLVDEICLRDGPGPCPLGFRERKKQIRETASQ